MFVEEKLIAQAWYVPLHDLDEALNGFFASGGYWSELWLANASLEVLKSPDLFEKIYKNTIFGRLADKISKVKLLVRNENYSHLVDSIGNKRSEIRRNFNKLDPASLSRIFIRQMESKDEALFKDTVGFCAPSGKLNKQMSPLAFYRLDDPAHHDHKRHWVLASKMNHEGMFADKTADIEECFGKSFQSIAEKLYGKISEDWRRNFYVSLTPRQEIRLLRVVALPSEMEAVGAIWPELHPRDSSYFEGVIMAPNERYHVFLIRPAEIWSVNAAINTTAAISEFRPDYVILLGIAGGREGKPCYLGDVLYSTSGFAYEYQTLKWDDSANAVKPDRKPRKINVGSNLLRWVANIGKDGKGEWTRKVRVNATCCGIKMPYTTYKVKAYQGVVLSGSKVIQTNEFFEDMCKFIHSDIGAVEMEAEGVGQATELLGKEFIMVKGISDYADQNKSNPKRQVYRVVAARAAAQFLREAIKAGRLRVK